MKSGMIRKSGAFLVLGCFLAAGIAPAAESAAERGKRVVYEALQALGGDAFLHMNDRVEAGALSAVFGSSLLVSSTKAVHGHAMGASGALEAIATVLGLVTGRVPPTANLSVVDPELPLLDYVRGSERPVDVEVALSDSFAFGGSNAVLAFRRTRR